MPILIIGALIAIAVINILAHSPLLKERGAIKRLLVGAATLFLIGVILPTIGFFILGSLICTSGLGLMFWVPVALMLGGVVVNIIQGIAVLFGRSGPKEEFKADEFSAEKGLPDENALRTYVKQCRSLGFENTTIAANLARAGWSDEKIEAAMKSAF